MPVCSKTMSRRALLGTMASAGALSALPPLALHAETAPQRGGTLRYGMNDGAQTDTLDPASWATIFVGVAFNGALCNNLVEILPDGTIAGDLAESWTSDAALRVWTFALRPGVTFHDGRPLTPNDVVQSLRHHMGAGSTSGALAVVSQIADIKAASETTVEITLHSANGDFPALLSDYHLSIFPAKEAGGIDYESGIGTGPYKLETFEPGIVVTMSRNAAYHKPGLPYFDAIELINILDDTARLNAFITGEVDVVEDIDNRNIAMIEANPALKVVRTPSLRHLTFDMNTQMAPFDNPAVRRALKLAIDRDDIIAKVFLGNATKGHDNPVAPIMPLYTDTQPEHRYDPKAARQILAEAGIENLVIDLSTAPSAFPGAVEAAVLFKDHAAKAGITINIIHEADDGYWDQVWLVKAFNASDWYGRVTLDWLFSTAYTSDAPWNNTGFKNPEFDALSATARLETDPAARAQIYAQMQQMLHEDGGVILVAFANWVLGMSAKIGHGPIGGILPADNHRCVERWWLNAQS